jgi:hypothetical protein
VWTWSGIYMAMAPVPTHAEGIVVEYEAGDGAKRRGKARVRTGLSLGSSRLWEGEKRGKSQSAAFRAALAPRGVPIPEVKRLRTKLGRFGPISAHSSGDLHYLRR